MQHFNVQTIYHAAAYKHVPMVEHNVLEGIRNNILGTWRTALAAQQAQVETFVLISTDKAVRPTNTMGATKRCAELLLQALNRQYGIKPTRFTMVRFGNVLGSSGSVVPLFQEQIRKGGAITLTHQDIIRYFMTIPEASQLVIQAGAMGQGGDVFVLDMGEPVRIYDLAKRMIKLSGLDIKSTETPEGDIEIQTTGLRPGEKLYEELLIGDNVLPTQHSRILRAQEIELPFALLVEYIQQFESLIEQQQIEAARNLLQTIVQEFKPQCAVVDLLYAKLPKVA
jgi:FlaA1/EpsC-like NDP-sugar epimerase